MRLLWLCTPHACAHAPCTEAACADTCAGSGPSHRLVEQGDELLLVLVDELDELWVLLLQALEDSRQELGLLLQQCADLLELRVRPQECKRPACTGASTNTSASALGLSLSLRNCLGLSLGHGLGLGLRNSLTARRNNDPGHGKAATSTLLCGGLSSSTRLGLGLRLCGCTPLRNPVVCTNLGDRRHEVLDCPVGVVVGRTQSLDNLLALKTHLAQLSDSTLVFRSDSQSISGT